MLPHAYRMLVWWLLHDASKREVSTQPKMTVLPTPTGCWCGLPCLSKLWYGFAVGYGRLMVLGKKDDLNTYVRTYGRM